MPKRYARDQRHVNVREKSRKPVNNGLSIGFWDFSKVMTALKNKAGKTVDVDMHSNP